MPIMKLKLYILFSLIIHFSFLLFSPEFKNKEKLKGEKIVPIEIIDNDLFNSAKGNFNQKFLNKKIKKTLIKNNELIKTKNISKPNKELTSRDEEISEGDFKINKKKINKKEIHKEDNKKLDKKNLSTEKKLDSNMISLPKKKGFTNKDDKKDLEKGSVKGKGKLKITCLDCVSPKYPKKALKKGLEGKPTVKVWILMNGNVQKAELIISSGISSIDKAALEAAKKSKFYPIDYDSLINIEYDLKLE